MIPGSKLDVFSINLQDLVTRLELTDAWATSRNESEAENELNLIAGPGHFSALFLARPLIWD